MFLLKSLIETLKPKIRKQEMPSPGEIRKMIKNMTRCSHCQFLIFDNYWSSETQKSNMKPCPTCGHSL